MSTTVESAKIAAGVGLDAIISAFVFNKVYKLFDRVRINGRWIEEPTWMPADSNAENPPPGMHAGHAPPRYSTNIESAWEVVKRFTPYIKVDARGINEDNEACWCCSIWLGGPEIKGYGATAPLAICRAALSGSRL